MNYLTGMFRVTKAKKKYTQFIHCDTWMQYFLLWNEKESKLIIYAYISKLMAGTKKGVKTDVFLHDIWQKLYEKLTMTVSK